MQNEPLNQIFEFLKSNRIYNKQVQESFYRSVINPSRSTNDKITSLLYAIANTQSQPNIDRLAEFFKHVHSHRNHLATFKEFAIMLNDKVMDVPRYEDIFNGLNGQKGWGGKTAALFVKSIYHLHNGEYDRELRIWDDAPSSINNNEKFYLPVDAVIQFIFKNIGVPCINDFKGINKYLTNSELYPGIIMEIWDDLWFWGFITQKGSGGKRTVEWNENKYWALPDTCKDEVTIAEIEQKASQFMSLMR